MAIISARREECAYQLIAAMGLYWELVRAIMDGKDHVMYLESV